MAKKARSDPNLKADRPSPVPIVHIAKDVAEIRTQVPNDIEDRTRHKDNIAIQSFTSLHFE
jgi:hypothetical protein